MKGSSALPYLAQAVALIGGLRRVWGCIILLPEATSIQCTLSQSRLLHAGISFQALALCLLQVPAFAGTDDHISTLAGCIVCLVTLAAYCIFQVGLCLSLLGLVSWQMSCQTTVCDLETPTLLAVFLGMSTACCPAAKCKSPCSLLRRACLPEGDYEKKPCAGGLP